MNTVKRAGHGAGAGQGQGQAGAQGQGAREKTRFWGLRSGKGQKPNLVWKRPMEAVWKSQIGGFGEVENTKFGGLESSLKAKKPILVAWRGSGKGQNANLEGLEGALVGLERLWKRPKSQFWGLGKALEKAKKPNSSARRRSGKGQRNLVAWRVWTRPKSQIWAWSGLEKAKKPNLVAWKRPKSQAWRVWKRPIKRLKTTKMGHLVIS